MEPTLALAAMGRLHALARRCGIMQSRHDPAGCKDTALWHLAIIQPLALNGRFSNRPVGVKRFQTIRHCGVDVARGLVLLSGIGTKALPLWDSKTGRNWAALPSD
jgi:hypothetical protein